MKNLRRKPEGVFVFFGVVVDIFFLGFFFLPALTSSFPSSLSGCCMSCCCLGCLILLLFGLLFLEQLLWLLGRLLGEIFELSDRGAEEKQFAEVRKNVYMMNPCSSQSMFDSAWSPITVQFFNYWQLQPVFQASTLSSVTGIGPIPYSIDLLVLLPTIHRVSRICM